MKLFMLQFRALNSLLFNLVTQTNIGFGLHKVWVFSWDVDIVTMRRVRSKIYAKYLSLRQPHPDIRLLIKRTVW